MPLTFRLGRIPVRILPSFFLTTGFFAFSAMRDLSDCIAWVLVVLGSVLLHELGHAMVGRAFGLEPRIQLHGLGGTTSWTATPRRLSTAQRVAISLAGPGMGFVAGGAVVLARSLLVPGVVPATRTVIMVSGMLRQVNFYWGVLNLLPMLPLDGGDVMAQLLNAFTRGRGERPARVASIVVAVSAALLALVSQQWWPALLAASFVRSNWQGLKALTEREHLQADPIARSAESRSDPRA